MRTAHMKIRSIAFLLILAVLATGLSACSESSEPDAAMADNTHPSSGAPKHDDANGHGEDDESEKGVAMDDAALVAAGIELQTSMTTIRILAKFCMTVSFLSAMRRLWKPRQH